MYIFLNRLLELFPIFASFIVMQIFAFNDGTVFHHSFLPSIAAICVFYWVFNYPQIVGTFSVFIIGLISDILFLYPIGVTSFSLLVAYLVTISQRELVVKYGFLLLWVSFGFFYLVFYIVQTFMMTLYADVFIFKSTMLAQFLLTILMYPIIHKIFSFMHIKRIVSFRM